MKVSELGEFGLIERLADIVGHDRGEKATKQLIIGIGDDAAVWESEACVQLATVDSLVQGVHFSLDTASWDDVGWKALAVNLSDIAAMGGLPEYALVSLALPGDSDVDDVVALYRGMAELAEQFRVVIVGGDTVSAPQLVINVTVFGSAARDEPVLTRSAARPGDLVAVTGSLGAAAAAVTMLGEGRRFGSEAAAVFKNALSRPCPRVAEGRVLVKHGVEAAIDISDGLVSDLDHICQASRVSARIDIDRVPVAPAVRDNFGERALELALAGGEDYELLFTASGERIDRVSAAVSCPVTVVGEIVPEGTGGVELVDSRGGLVRLPGKGWDHFSAARSQR